MRQTPTPRNAHRWPRRALNILLAAGVGLGAVACGDDDTGGSAGTDGGSPETTAGSGGDNDNVINPSTETASIETVPPSQLDQSATFRMSYSVGPSRWDAHRASSSYDNVALFLTYDRLVHINPAAEPVPGLATDWRFADDGSYLEMDLRKGVTFHDGEPFNAQAVKANITRGKNVRSSAITGDLQVVDSVRIVDSHTVRLMLNGPAASLPLVLSGRPGVMISPAAFDNPQLDQQPVGAGMFRVTDYVPDDHITYQRYENYWDQDAVNVARIQYLIQANSTTRLNALRGGQVDWAEIDPIDTDQAEDAGLNVQAASSLSFYHLQLNRTFEPFADEQVRQALNYAVDREAMVEGLLRGYGEANSQPFPEGYRAFNEELGSDHYSYDPERARQLLAEAGYEDGFEFQLVIPNQSYYQQLAAAVQAQLAEVGIQTNIRAVPGAQIADIFYVQEQGEGMIAPWGGRHDPSQTLELLYSNEGFSNPGQKSTPEFMEAYRQTLKIQAEQQRAQALQEATGIVVEQALDVPLYNQFEPWVQTDSVANFRPYLSTKHEFRGLGMTK